MSTFYVVATPIGNLEDITYRAVRILGEVDTIACEDTRHTQIVLSRYNITGKRLIACHARNEANSAAGIVKLLEEGHDIAYASDAGTPGISDPGSRVVKAVREAGFPVVPLPGPSAVAALVSAAGCCSKSFTFEGFLSPKGGRRKSRLTELLGREEAFVIYESPYRVEKTLALLAEMAPDRIITVGREMTKAFEEFETGTASELLGGRIRSFKGEFAMLVHPQFESAEQEDEE
jgi:16S rRNA (cytidine1402-2'-O)-methyltransferase